MNLLLVDDEIYAAERIQNMMDWDALGIQQVKVANSMQQAIRIFEVESVDIMLCDIEMPRGSGIELAEWVRSRNYHTVILFLTCHAQFAYAKDAMRLRSQDYLLKPIDKETLHAALLRAVAVACHEKRLQRLTQSDALWKNNQCNILEYFWLQVAQGTFSGGTKEIVRVASERGIPLRENTELYAVCIVLQNYDENWGDDDRRLIAYAQLNIARELFEQDGSMNGVAEINRGVLIAICCPADTTPISELEDSVRKYTEVCKQNLGLEISCCISGRICPAELCASIERIIKIARPPKGTTANVWIEDASKPQPRHLPRPEMQAWSQMLQQGAYRQVRESVISFFQKPEVTGSLSVSFLQEFQQTFLEILSDYCRNKTILSRKILDCDDQLLIKAVRSVPDMLIWINIVLNRCEMADTTGLRDDPILMAKHFITENLDQEISREDIARYVHLNPDYLSRIFKKELGISVIDYLIELRIEMAKKLLRDTNMRVSDVAGQVGYSNFSHFSKLFKKKVGVNPNQYKRRASHPGGRKSE